MRLSSPSPTRRKAEPIEILLEASEIVSGHSLNLDDLLHALAELIRKVVDYQIFAVLLRSGKSELRIRYAIGYRQDLVEKLRIPLGDGITGLAAQQKQTIIVNDVLNDSRYIMAIDAVRSEISVPLIARNKLVGVIDLQSTTPNAFGEEAKNLLELIGSRFSLAIDAARLHRATVRQNRTLRTLAQISQEFSHILQLKELLSKIASLVRDLIPYDALSIFLMERDAAILKHYFGVRYDERVRAESMPLGKGIVGAAALTQQPVLVRDTSKDQRYVAALEGIRSEVAVPLMLQDRVVGVLDLESEQLGSFTMDHVQTLSLLAPQLASAVENARLYEEVAHHKERLEVDLTTARELQKHLLPAALPVWEGIEIAACNQSATEISGDLYDFFPFSGDHVGFLIGDVSGKGAAAALYAALVSGILRNQAAPEQTPADLMLRVNEALLRRKVEALYLTALYAQWYPQTRRLVLCSAGQPQPVVCRAGHAEILPLSGYPLGMFDLSDYENVEYAMQPGDVFVAVSDGITEAGYPSKRPYGEERLMRLIEANCSLSAPLLLETICGDIGAYTEGLAQEDDRTVIVARIHE